jgi:hypothetical protein
MNKVSSPSTKYTAVTTQIALDTKKQLAQTRNKNVINRQQQISSTVFDD